MNIPDTGKYCPVGVTSVARYAAKASKKTKLKVPPRKMRIIQVIKS
jgi:hypothetical protein